MLLASFPAAEAIETSEPALQLPVQMVLGDLRDCKKTATIKITEIARATGRVGRATERTILIVFSWSCPLASGPPRSAANVWAVGLPSGRRKRSGYSLTTPAFFSLNQKQLILTKSRDSRVVVHSDQPRDDGITINSVRTLRNLRGRLRADELYFAIRDHDRQVFLCRCDRSNNDSEVVKNEPGCTDTHEVREITRLLGLGNGGRGNKQRPNKNRRRILYTSQDRPARIGRGQNCAHRSQTA